MLKCNYAPLDKKKLVFAWSRNQSGAHAWRNTSRRRKNETFCRVCHQGLNHFNQSDTGADKEDRLQRNKLGFNLINVTLFAVRKKWENRSVVAAVVVWLFTLSSLRLFELFLRMLLRLPLFAQKTQNLTLGAGANTKSCLLSACVSCHPSAECLIFNMFPEPGITGLLPHRH